MWDVDTSQEVLRLNWASVQQRHERVLHVRDGSRLAAFLDYAGAANVYDTTPHDPSPAVPPRKP